MKINLLQINPPSPLQQLCIAINQLINGGSNSVGTITLTANATQTILRNNLITSQSVIFFTPQTAHAQTLGIPWADPTSVPVTGNFLGGSITLNHGSAAQTDLTFGYEIRN